MRNGYPVNKGKPFFCFLMLKTGSVREKMRTPKKIPLSVVIFTSIGLLLPILNELILDAYLDHVSADHLSEIFWFVTIIPSVLFSYYSGLRGALLIAFIGLILNLSIGVIEGFQDLYLYSFVLVAFLHFTIAFSVGFLADKLLSKEYELLVLNDKLEQLSIMDDLTGLLNRRGFMSTANDALVQSQESCCIFIDIDGFKPVNDDFGHEYGDRLLIQLAKRLQSSIREQDLVARLGGDEFVCLLAKANKQKAEEIALRIKHHFSIPIHIYGYDFTITPSIGISLFPLHGKTIHELVKNADTAMYEAKRKGKNQVFFFRGTDKY
jgi:diguanylate cyclase (GGDEF)-like protein